MVAISKSQLIASICKESFYDFVQEFWDEVVKEKPIWNWHIKFLCDELQRAAELVFAGKPREMDYIINVPPGTTKSTVCSVMFPAWVLTRMPHARIIAASHTENLVQDLSAKSRMVVQSEKYKECFPQVRLREDQNTKTYWATDEGGFRFSATVGGKNPTGFHAHFLIVDDPIDPTKAFSEAELKVANDFMDLTISNRKVDQEIAVTILVMQRLHEDDPTGHRLKNKDMGKVRHICLPAEENEDIRPKHCRKFYREGLLDPVRLSRKVLKEKMGMGRFGYAGQYMQNPVPLGGGMFDISKLNFGKVPPLREFLNPITGRLNIFRYWDKAGTKDDGARTAGVKIGQDNSGRIWVMHVEKGQWAAFEREQVIYNTAVMDGKEIRVGVEQEPGSGGKESAESTAKNLLGWTVILDKPTGDKFVRAEPFASQVGAGNVYLPDNAEWTRDYVDEMRNFGPKGKYKDQIDASSGGFALVSQPVLVIGAF